MSKKSWQGGAVRTTVTMPRKLRRELLVLMERHGYGTNFSAFIAQAARNQRDELLRREKSG